MRNELCPSKRTEPVYHGVNTERIGQISFISVFCGSLDALWLIKYPILLKYLLFQA